MNPGIYDFIIYQGQTFRRSIECQDSSLMPVDFTGYTAVMQIRATKDPTSTLYSTFRSQSPGVNDGVITFDYTGGVMTLSMTAAQTALLTGWTTAKYDLKIITNGEENRLLEGTVTLDLQVTTENA